MFNITISEELIDYLYAVDYMQSRVQAIKNGAKEEVWFLQHQPLFTLGTSATPNDIIEKKFPVYTSQRGGKVTYHGPGQLVVYVMLDLKKRNNDPRSYVFSLEQWIIATLENFGIKAVRKPSRIGVWLENNEIERKIAAIGVRISHGITWHGLSLNISTNLSHYDYIVPCGLKDFAVTSMLNEGVKTDISSVIEIMKNNMESFIGLPC